MFKGTLKHKSRLEIMEELRWAINIYQEVGAKTSTASYSISTSISQYNITSTPSHKTSSINPGPHGHERHTRIHLLHRPTTAFPLPNTRTLTKQKHTKESSTLLLKPMQHPSSHTPKYLAPNTHPHPFH